MATEKKTTGFHTGECKDCGASIVQYADYKKSLKYFYRVCHKCAAAKHFNEQMIQHLTKWRGTGL